MRFVPVIRNTASRLLWGLLALQVLLIGAAVQDAGLHSWLHGVTAETSHGHHHEKDGCPHEGEDLADVHVCAVTLFAEGLETALCPALEFQGPVAFGQLLEDAPSASEHARWITLVARAPPVS